VKPISELSTGNGLPTSMNSPDSSRCWKWVPDSGSCDVETPPAESWSKEPGCHDVQPNRNVLNKRCQWLAWTLLWSRQKQCCRCSGKQKRPL